jgi:hypothetical protein
MSSEESSVRAGLAGAREAENTAAGQSVGWRNVEAAHQMLQISKQVNNRVITNVFLVWQFPLRIDCSRLYEICVENYRYFKFHLICIMFFEVPIQTKKTNKSK